MDVVVLDVGSEVLEEPRNLQETAVCHAVLEERPIVGIEPSRTLTTRRRGGENSTGAAFTRKPSRARTLSEVTYREGVLTMEEEEANAHGENIDVRLEAHGVEVPNEIRIHDRQYVLVPAPSSQEQQHSQRHQQPSPSCHTTRSDNDTDHVAKNRLKTRKSADGVIARNPNGENAKRYNKRCHCGALFHVSNVHGEDWLNCAYLMLLLARERARASIRT